MLKVITGMVLATILLGIGFWAGHSVTGQNEVVIANDFDQMVNDTASKISYPATKGKK